MSPVKKAKYRRILLKLSGEALGGKGGSGINPEALQSIAGQVAEVKALGVEVVIVVGGGNIFRGLEGSEKGIERATGDYMGMLATVINSLALQDALEKLGTPTRVTYIDGIYAQLNDLDEVGQALPTIATVAGEMTNPTSNLNLAVGASATAIAARDAAITAQGLSETARDVAAVWGLSGAAGSLAAAFAQPVIGWLIDHYSYAPVFGIVSFMHIVSALAVVLLIRRIAPVALEPRPGSGPGLPGPAK